MASLAASRSPAVSQEGAGRAGAACRLPTLSQSEVTGQGRLLQEKQEAGPDMGLETKVKMEGRGPPETGLEQRTQG